jgi:hypothetical protein
MKPSNNRCRCASAASSRAAFRTNRRPYANSPADQKLASTPTRRANGSDALLV